MLDWDLADIALKALGITGGTLGVVSFFWTLWDRIDRRKATSPFAEIELFIANKNDDGWIPARFWIKNRWDEPVTIKSVATRRGLLAMAQKSPDGGIYAPDETRMGRSLTVAWRVKASDAEKWSAKTELFIKDGSSGKFSLNRMLFTLEAISASNRRIQIRPTIRINNVSKADAGKK